MSLIPFAVFIVVTIVLSFANFQDINMMVAAGVIGLLIGMIFCKNPGDYWDVVLAGLGSKVAMTAVMLWLVVGIYGNILKSGHIVEGLVWLSVKLGISGSVFTVAAFIFAALFAMATGSGFQLLAMNGGVVFSDDERMSGSLLCNAAIEARVIGLDKPAMSITGSGAHGIIATMPIYGVYKINGHTMEQLCRATMLSYLTCTYIKEYSGRLSAFCGCAIAAGSGMACAIVYLKGGGVKEMEYALNNMASSITGMICDGGNQGCTMKGVAACDAAFRSVEFAMNGVHIDKVHGINGATPEDTMRNMGLIASPGMIGTEKTIVEIFEKKVSGDEIFYG